MNYPKEQVRRMAQSLARSNKLAEPGICKIYWFPDLGEIRLIEVDQNVPPSQTEQIEPFYFAAAPVERLMLPSAIAIIHPSEDSPRMALPTDWGTWQIAEVWDKKELERLIQQDWA